MYLVSQKDYIAHHGIKGQKWGVRRFQNKDGTLTAAGKKRQQIIEKAAKEAEDEVDYHKDMVRHYSKPYADKYYSGKDGYKKWLQDNYGDDWKDPDYMKRVFEVDDVKKHALEEISEELKQDKLESENMTKYYLEGLKYWEQQASLYENVSIFDISSKDYRKAKKYARYWDRR